jgi:hypothetical protein
MRVIAGGVLTAATLSLSFGCFVNLGNLDTEARPDAGPIALDAEPALDHAVPPDTSPGLPDAVVIDTATPPADTAPDTGPPVIAKIQVNCAPEVNGTVPTQAASFGMAQHQGDLNIVVTSWLGTGTSVVSVTDTAGNHYEPAGVIQYTDPDGAGDGVAQGIYYAAGIAGSASNTVTVSFAGASGGAYQPDTCVVEYAGVSKLDQYSDRSGDGPPAGTSAVTIAHQPEVLFAAGSAYNGFAGPVQGSGFSLIVLTGYSNLLEGEITTTIGPYVASAVVDPDTDGGLAGWVMQFATFY